MSKIYVITSGSYSDYRILTATTSLKKAQEFIKQYNNITDLYSQLIIEVYEDLVCITQFMYNVDFDYPGQATLYSIELITNDCEEKVRIWKDKQGGSVWVIAKNTQAAIKIASERYFAARAQGIEI